MIKKAGFSRRSFLAGTGAVAAGFTIAGKFPVDLLAAEEKKLVFYNWDTYTGKKTLSGFKEKYGIEVKMDLFGDNEELYGKLKNGNSGYDVICPTGDTVGRMIQTKIIVPLDYSKIPNAKNLFPRFRNSAFDPGRKYSVTYLWGTLGIGYNSKRVKETPDSWKYLYNSDQYAGRLALLGSTRDLFGLGLKYLGYSVNDQSDKHLQEVTDMLIKQKKYIKSFHNDNGQDLLLAGDVDLVSEYSGDILQVHKENNDLLYLVPKEGSIIWQDNLAIPAKAPHPDNAHKFINYILDADVEVDIAETVQYPTPNEAAFKKLPKSYTSDPMIFPDAATMNKLEEAKFLGVKYDQKLESFYSKVKSA